MAVRSDKHDDESGKAAIIGMGYVGAVTAAAMAGRGWRVTGVEINPTKLAMLQAGKSPVSEPGLVDAFARATADGRLDATDDLTQAVTNAELIMVAVGTPSAADGEADLQAIDRVTIQLAQAMAARKHRCVVMIRSTVPPGTTRHRVAPIIHDADPQAAVCHHPEFLREGSALADWTDPPMIVVGADGKDAVPTEKMIERLYEGIDAPRLALATAESELMKYACNVFHAIKIDFANEIGSLAAACGADPNAVMKAFCNDRKLNISPAYLRPGFAFGGSCLGKDTRAVAAKAQRAGLKLPLIESVIESNHQHLSRQVNRILRLGRRPALLLGLSFKADTDDLRESPMVELAERLLGKGIPLAIYDPDVSQAGDRLLGANARYIHEHLPHLNALLRDDLANAAGEAQTIIIGKPVKGLTDAMLAGKDVVDLTAGPAVEGDGAGVQKKAA